MSAVNVPDVAVRRGSWLSRLPIRRENYAYAGIFLAPTFLLVLALIIYPLLFSLSLTFSQVSSLGGERNWVGFNNWARLFGDPLFAQSFVQTVMYVVPACILAVVIGLGVALVLNQDFPGRMLVRASLLIPWALPPVVVAAMFQWFLDGRRGLLSPWLVQLGLADTPPAFFTGVPGTLYTLVGIHVWKTFPLIALIFLVSLQYLPRETVHAAQIDGANGWRRFRYVTFPFLLPTIGVALIIQLLVTIQLFDLIFALTGGGPGAYSTYNLYFYAFKTSFEHTNLSYGAVLAYVVTAIIIVFGLLLTRGGRSLRLS
jgi:ABC-type sugar transport system permease subunit